MKTTLLLLLLLALAAAAVAAPIPDSSLGLSEVAWTGPEQGEVYFGSPSIVRVPGAGGPLLASHDYFGDKAVDGVVQTYRSDDNGTTWSPAGAAHGVYWATLFAHGGAVYLLGTASSRNANNSVTICRSDDEGASWSPAATLLEGAGNRTFSTGPTPVLLHENRLWRAFEVSFSGGRWARDFSSVLVSAPAAAGTDLTDPASWTACEPLAFGDTNSSVWASWSRPGVRPDPGWLEGNAVPLPASAGGGVGVLMRVNSVPAVNWAALLRLVPPASAASAAAGAGRLELVEFLPGTFPGGLTKFTVRLHEPSGMYVALVNDPYSSAMAVSPACAAVGTFDHLAMAHSAIETGSPELPHCSLSSSPECDHPCVYLKGIARNRLSLTVSSDLVSWKKVATLLEDDTGNAPWTSALVTGFQYVDWQFSGEGGRHVVAAIRTSYRGAFSFHDANRLTVRSFEWASLAGL